MGPFARIPQDPATDSELLVGALVARMSVFWRDVFFPGFQGSRTVFCLGAARVPLASPRVGGPLSSGVYTGRNKMRPPEGGPRCWLRTQGGC